MALWSKQKDRSPGEFSCSVIERVNTPVAFNINVRIMSSRSDEHDEYSETTIKAEIKKTLLSINDTTHKIKSELDAINFLTKKNGQLHTAVTDANEILSKVAKDMNISRIENLLNDDKEDDEAVPQFGNVFSSSAFQEKILRCLNDV